MRQDDCRPGQAPFRFRVSTFSEVVKSAREGWVLCQLSYFFNRSPRFTAERLESCGFIWEKPKDVSAAFPSR